MIVKVFEKSEQLKRGRNSLLPLLLLLFILFIDLISAESDQAVSSDVNKKTELDPLLQNSSLFNTTQPPRDKRTLHYILRSLAEALGYDVRSRNVTSQAQPASPTPTVSEVHPSSPTPDVHVTRGAPEETTRGYDGTTATDSEFIPPSKVKGRWDDSGKTPYYEETTYTPRRGYIIYRDGNYDGREYDSSENFRNERPEYEEYSEEEEEYSPSHQKVKEEFYRNKHFDEPRKHYEESPADNKIKEDFYENKHFDKPDRHYEESPPRNKVKEEFYQNKNFDEPNKHYKESPIENNAKEKFYQNRNFDEPNRHYEELPPQNKAKEEFYQNENSDEPSRHYEELPPQNKPKEEFYQNKNSDEPSRHYEELPPQNKAKEEFYQNKNSDESSRQPAQNKAEEFHQNKQNDESNSHDGESSSQEKVEEEFYKNRDLDEANKPDEDAHKHQRVNEEFTPNKSFNEANHHDDDSPHHRVKQDSHYINDFDEAIKDDELPVREYVRSTVIPVTIKSEIIHKTYNCNSKVEEDCPEQTENSPLSLPNSPNQIPPPPSPSSWVDFFNTGQRHHKDRHIKFNDYRTAAPSHRIDEEIRERLLHFNFPKIFPTSARESSSTVTEDKPSSFYKQVTKSFTPDESRHVKQSNSDVYLKTFSPWYRSAEANPSKEYIVSSKSIFPVTKKWTKTPLNYQLNDITSAPIKQSTELSVTKRQEEYTKSYSESTPVLTASKPALLHILQEVEGAKQNVYAPPPFDFAFDATDSLLVKQRSSPEQVATTASYPVASSRSVITEHNTTYFPSGLLLSEGVLSGNTPLLEIIKHYPKRSEPLVLNETWTSYTTQVNQDVRRNTREQPSVLPTINIQEHNYKSDTGNKESEGKILSDFSEHNPRPFGRSVEIVSEQTHIDSSERNKTNRISSTVSPDVTVYIPRETLPLAEYHNMSYETIPNGNTSSFEKHAFQPIEIFPTASSLRHENYESQNEPKTHNEEYSQQEKQRKNSDSESDFYKHYREPHFSFSEFNTHKPYEPDDSAWERIYKNFFGPGKRGESYHKNPSTPFWEKYYHKASDKPEYDKSYSQDDSGSSNNRPSYSYSDSKDDITHKQPASTEERSDYTSKDSSELSHISTVSPYNLTVRPNDKTEYYDIRPKVRATTAKVIHGKEAYPKQSIEIQQSQSSNFYDGNGNHGSLQRHPTFSSDTKDPSSLLDTDRKQELIKVTTTKSYESSEKNLEQNADNRTLIQERFKTTPSPSGFTKYTAIKRNQQNESPVQSAAENTYFHSSDIINENPTVRSFYINVEPFTVTTVAPLSYTKQYSPTSVPEKQQQSSTVSVVQDWRLRDKVTIPVKH